uniref:Sulfite exporter TauE/SafE family protein n=1 Tax=Acrobeloides nanus TaxID=290746 RepID=A0A914DUT2_9BILA
MKVFPTNAQDLQFYNTTYEHIGEAEPFDPNFGCSSPYLAPNVARTKCILPCRFDLAKHFMTHGGVDGLKEKYEMLATRMQSFGRYIFNISHHPVLEKLFESEAFIKSAKKICPLHKQILDPFQYHFIIQIPGQVLPVHLDAAIFEHASRFQYPTWLPVVMVGAGLHKDKFIDQVQGVAYLHEWNDTSFGGHLAYYTENSNKPSIEIPYPRGVGFMDGQKLEGSAAQILERIPEDAGFEEKLFTKYRKYIAVLIPFTICQFLWWCTAIKHDFLSLYSTKWEMPLTMFFGATIAGMTSEGGGSVAFPVMTFVLHIKPNDARDFSLMIQSFGMTMASFTILFMRVKVEWRSIIFGSIGAIPGSILGFEFLDTKFSAEQKKMFFVSIWSSFAVALWILNREYKRKTFDQIQNFSPYKAIVLLATGFVGGIFTSFAGSGLDICTFSIITLLFRVSEKTATPTSIVLMAMNTIFCFYWRAMIDENISQTSWDYLKICIPIVVLMAPFGRVGAAIIFGGFVFFEILCRIGKRLVIEEAGQKQKPDDIA